MVVVQRPSPLHGMPTIFKWRSSTASGIQLESSSRETKPLGKVYCKPCNGNSDLLLGGRPPRRDPSSVEAVYLQEEADGVNLFPVQPFHLGRGVISSRPAASPGPCRSRSEQPDPQPWVTSHGSTPMVLQSCSPCACRLCLVSGKTALLTVCERTVNINPYCHSIAYHV